MSSRRTQVAIYSRSYSFTLPGRHAIRILVVYCDVDDALSVICCCGMFVYGGGEMRTVTSYLAVIVPQWSEV